MGRSKIQTQPRCGPDPPTGPHPAFEDTMDTRFRLCPRCLRAVPHRSGECYCINDGEPLITCCPTCHTPIHNPYTRHCAGCGLDFTRLVKTEENQP